MAAGDSGLGLKPGSRDVVASSLKAAVGWVGRPEVISKAEVTAISVAFWLVVVGNCVWGMSVGVEWVMENADCGVSVGSAWVVGSIAELRVLFVPGS